MRKAFKLEELDCANCAAKMEAAINKLDGVNSAKITFMTAKLILDVEDGRLEEILDKAQAEISKVEPDCRIVR